MNKFLLCVVKILGHCFKSLKLPLFSTDFMSAWAWRASNGEIYTAVKTAPAVTVLPYWQEGERYYVLLIEQSR